MRTNLGLLDVESRWFRFAEEAGDILTDLLVERNRSRKLDFRLMGFSEVGLPLYGVLSSAPCEEIAAWH